MRTTVVNRLRCTSAIRRSSCGRVSFVPLMPTSTYSAKTLRLLLDGCGRSCFQRIHLWFSADAKGNRACNRCHSRHPSVPLRLRLD